MAIETHVRSGAAWRKAARVYIKSGGVWRDCKEVYVRAAGTWRRVFTPWTNMTAATGADGGGGTYSGYMGVTDTGWPLFGSVSPASVPLLDASIVMCYATRDDQGLFNGFGITLGNQFLVQSSFTTLNIVGTGVNVSLSSASASFFTNSTAPSGRAFWNWTTPDILFTAAAVYSLEFIV